MFPFAPSNRAHKANAILVPVATTSEAAEIGNSNNIIDAENGWRDPSSNFGSGPVEIRFTRLTNGFSKKKKITVIRPRCINI